MNPSHICPALLCGLSSRPSCGFLFSYFPVRHGASKSSDMGGALVWFHGRGISLSCKILKALSTKRRDGDSTFVGKINDAASPRHRHEASLLRSLNNLLRADRLEVVLRLPPSLSLCFLVPSFPMTRRPIGNKYLAEDEIESIAGADCRRKEAAANK